MKTHKYKVNVSWTGNKGTGTQDYKSYDRSHVVEVVGKYDPIKGSSDPDFRGDPSKYNPEELFLSSLSSCHMLWYLHLCAVNKIVVTAYHDNASGSMEEYESGGGRFVEVLLSPVVTIEKEKDLKRAITLHEEANKLCFIANSCNFKIKHEAVIVVN